MYSVYTMPIAYYRYDALLQHAWSRRRFRGKRLGVRCKRDEGAISGKLCRQLPVQLAISHQLCMQTDVASSSVLQLCNLLLAAAVTSDVKEDVIGVIMGLAPEHQLALRDVIEEVMETHACSDSMMAASPAAALCSPGNAAFITAALVEAMPIPLAAPVADSEVSVKTLQRENKFLREENVRFTVLLFPACLHQPLRASLWRCFTDGAADPVAQAD